MVAFSPLLGASAVTLLLFSSSPATASPASPASPASTTESPTATITGGPAPTDVSNNLQARWWPSSIVSVPKGQSSFFNTQKYQGFKTSRNWLDENIEKASLKKLKPNRFNTPENKYDKYDDYDGGPAFLNGAVVNIAQPTPEPAIIPRDLEAKPTETPLSPYIENFLIPPTPSSAIVVSAVHKPAATPVTPYVENYVLPSGALKSAFLSKSTTALPALPTETPASPGNDPKDWLGPEYARVFKESQMHYRELLQKEDEILRKAKHQPKKPKTHPKIGEAPHDTLTTVTLGTGDHVTTATLSWYQPPPYIYHKDYAKTRRGFWKLHQSTITRGTGEHATTATSSWYEPHPDVYKYNSNNNNNKDHDKPQPRRGGFWRLHRPQQAAPATAAATNVAAASASATPTTHDAIAPEVVSSSASVTTAPAITPPPAVVRRAAELEEEEFDKLDAEIDALDEAEADTTPPAEVYQDLFYWPIQTFATIVTTQTLPQGVWEHVKGEETEFPESPFITIAPEA